LALHDHNHNDMRTARVFAALAFACSLVRATALSGHASSSLVSVVSVEPSRIALSPFASLITCSVDVLRAAVNASVLPPLPTVASLGPARVGELKSRNRKLTLKQATNRQALLVEFYNSAYGAALPLASFMQWAQPLYLTTLRNLGLANVGHFKNQAKHRTLLFGLGVAQAFATAATSRLNHFALLDPIESRFYTGFVPDPSSSAAAGVTPSSSGRSRDLTSYPAYFDLRNVLAMPPVRDQRWLLALAAPRELKIVRKRYNRAMRRVLGVCGHERRGTTIPLQQPRRRRGRAQRASARVV